MARSKQQGRKRKQNENVYKQDTERGDGYATIVKENAMFEKYYKQLNLIEPSEFEMFMNVLKQPLPIAFRITSYKSFSEEILKILKEKHFKYIDEITKENAEEVKQASANKGASLLTANKEENSSLNEDKEIYKRLTWYPNELGWQVNLSRQDVRKNVHFEEFKQFLIQHTENGLLNRQEAVSMIPPLLLDVQPHHKVLDMCASPGSKTAQLIEFLHRDPSNPIPEGFVIANDLDNKRCYMLMHQLKRLESPNFMIINHDASALPNFRSGPAGDPNTKNVLFDRILADVPCSGDGTTRKNVDMWTKWNFAHACNLHGIQSRIARRAVELLAPGGIMVYSTCSLNPVENEAVVYNLLLKFKDQIELVDARHKLTGMKTVHGLTKWNVMSKTGDLYQTHEDVPANFQYLIRPYMFPPEESVANDLNLDRCIRVLPHHQNTGGFFIAVIRKRSEGVNSDEKAEEEKTVEEVSGASAVSGSLQKDNNKVMKAPPAKRVKHTYDENPFHFFDEENKLYKDWPKIKEFYGVRDDFPVEQMMTRNRPTENVKNVYFVSKYIRELTMNNSDRFKFINMGVPLFSRYELKDLCNVELRVCQESLDIMLKYFTRRVMFIKERSDLINLLSNSMPYLKEFSQEFQDEISAQTQNLVGSIVMTAKSLRDGKGSELNLPISFTAWIGKASIRPLTNLHVRKFFLSLINVDQKQIDEAMDKIKAEDKANSDKSRQANPQFKANKLKVENKDLDALSSDDEAKEGEETEEGNGEEMTA